MSGACRECTREAAFRIVIEALSTNEKVAEVLCPLHMLAYLAATAEDLAGVMVDLAVNP